MKATRCRAQLSSGRVPVSRSRARASSGAAALAVLAGLASVALSPACSKCGSDSSGSSSSAASARPSPSTSSSAARPAPPSQAPHALGAADGAAAPAVPGDPMATLFGRMALEKKNRPDVHPNVDDAFAALAKAGATVPKPAQSMARTYAASYCLHGVDVSGDLSILLCEYPDEAAAVLGLAESKKIMANVETRTSYVHKSLLMVTMLLNAEHLKPASVIQNKALAAFNAL